MPPVTMLYISFFVLFHGLGLAIPDNFDWASVLQERIVPHGKLTGDADGRRNIKREASGGKSLQPRKYGRSHLPIFDLNRAKSKALHGRRYVMTMHNNDDLDYTAVIHVNGQPLRCIFDTGSFEVVIFSNYCKTYSCSNTSNLYQPNASDTYDDLRWQKNPLLWQRRCAGAICEGSYQFRH